MPASSKRAKEIKEDSATLVALIVECDCVLDFCLEQDSYNSGLSKTNKVFYNLMTPSKKRTTSQLSVIWRFNIIVSQIKSQLIADS